MSDINMNSILSKARACTASNEKKAQVRNLIDKNMSTDTDYLSGALGRTPTEAASKFKEVLLDEIRSSGLSSNAKSAISEIDYGSPFKIRDGLYGIHVYFSGDMHRDSLVPERYPEGIDDLSMLLNYGVDHKMKPVFGWWHGEEVWSKTAIPGTYFIEQAIQNFKDNYASDYNVVDIEIADKE